MTPNRANLRLFQQAMGGLVCMGSAFLVGSFFVHWVPDHESLWRGAAVLDSGIQNSLAHYAFISQAPYWYFSTLGAVGLLVVSAAVLKLLFNGLSGMLFDGGSLLLLFSAFAIFSTNVRGTLSHISEQLPLDAILSGGAPTPESLKQAVKSLAAANMIIAVSLTGVLSLQAAQAYSDIPYKTSYVRSAPVDVRKGKGKGKEVTGKK